MVIRRRDEEQVNGLRHIEPVTTHLYGPERRDSKLSGLAPQVVERGLARVKRIDDAVRCDNLGHAQGEVSSAGTEIAHDHPRSETENGDDRVRVAQAILAGTAGI